MLSRRDYTSAELRQKLRDREYDDAAIDAALDDLRERRFIDDARVAGAHVRTAARVKGRGRVRIARELTSRGLSRGEVDEALKGLDPADEATMIRAILVRRRWPAKPSMAERQKMYRHLLGRGFTADAIGKAIGRGAGPDED